MIHMLSAFDLKPDEDMASFRSAYADFIAELLEADLVLSSGPIGRRVKNTPMDTDGDRSQEYFSILTFQDRAQLDGAYAHIARRQELATLPHNDMYARITNAVFLCWQEDA